MSNDLISRSHFDDRVRLAAGPDADLEYSADFLDGIKVVLYMLGNEPAVPHEMSAKELLHAERRMYNEDSDAYLEYSSLVIEEEMESALCYIEAWAREHPEERSEALKEDEIKNDEWVNIGMQGACASFEDEEVNDEN